MPYSIIKIAVHNHPTNIMPTGSDFVTAAARGYAFGVVVTHDCRVYKYTAPTAPVRAAAIDAVIDKHTKFLYTETEKRNAFTAIMNELNERYGITWEEM